jgi:hypothetical protein
MESTIDLIQAIANKEPVEAERMFNQIMSDRIAAKIEDRKVDIAQSLFANRQDLESAVDDYHGSDQDASERV